MPRITGTSGNDTLVGGPQGDEFIASAGNDTLDGGAGGPNALSYAHLSTPLSLRFTGVGAGIAATVGGNTTFSNITTIFGSQGANVLVGGDGTEVLLGGAGADSLSGGGGGDVLDGAAGDDTLDGGAGYDVERFGAPQARRGASFALQPNGDVVQTLAGQSDTLRGMEEVRFADGSERFDPEAVVAQVTRLYDSAFGRAPEATGLHAWTVQIKLGATLATVAQAFADAPEYGIRYGAASDADYVEQLYQNTLHRASDPQGKAGWLDLMARGMARGEVLVGFSESPEHRANTAGAVQDGIWDLDDAAAQVARLYDTTLERLPDASGLQGWVEALNGGSSLSGVAAGFVGSVEFQAIYGSLSNGEFVDQLYLNTLGRTSESAGRDGWVGALDSGALTRPEVVVGFSESPEHAVLTASTVFGSGPGQVGVAVI